MVWIGDHRWQVRVPIVAETLSTWDGVEQFGEGRVIDTPLAESGIAGTAIGMSLAGLRPGRSGSRWRS